MRKRRKYQLGCLWAVVALGVLLGCAPHKVELKPVTLATLDEGKTLPIPIALCIEEIEKKPLKEFMETPKLSTPYGGPIPYEFNVGEAMATAIEDQMHRIFKKVEMKCASTPESLGQAGLAGEMRIGLQKSPKESPKKQGLVQWLFGGSNGFKESPEESPKKSPFIDIRFEPDIIETVAKANYEFDWEASFRDTEGTEHFSRSEVKGIKFDSKIATMGNKDAFAPGIRGAIENGLQQLSDYITNDAPLRDFTEATLVKEMKAGVVAVRSAQIGTGFIVQLSGDAAYIVTAAHVLGGDRRPTVAFFSRQNQYVPASVIGQGESGLDLALLLVKGNLPSRLMVLPLAPSISLDEEDEVRMVGQPLQESGVSWSVIKGIVTFRERQEKGGKEQIIVAPIGEAFGVGGTLVGGSSGGPVIRGGQVVGLVIKDRPRAGFGNVISTASIMRFLERWGVRGIRGGE